MRRPTLALLAEIIGIVAFILLLAAIIFPIFAKAKIGGGPGSDTSRAYGVMSAAKMYAADHDDFLPDCPVDGIVTESYVFMAKVEPYRGHMSAKVRSSPYAMGAVQHEMHDVPPELGGGFDITPPNDPCVGLPTSKYGREDSATSHYFGDVYPASDFGLTPILWGYVQGGCPPGGVTDGYSHPGANVATGLDPEPGRGTNHGVNFLGPGKVEIGDPSKVVLAYTFPIDRGMWPGPAFWDQTSSQNAADRRTTIAYLDNHTKALTAGEMLGGKPGLLDRDAYPFNGYKVSQQNWNPPYAAGHPKYGRAFYWWGTQLASPGYR